MTRVSAEPPRNSLRERAPTSRSCTSPRRRRSEPRFFPARGDAYSSAQNVKKAIEKDGRKCLTLAYDLMDENNVKEIVDKHIKEYGRLDILVNNASKQIMCKNIEDIKVGLGISWMVHADSRWRTSRAPSEATSSPCSP